MEPLAIGECRRPFQAAVFLPDCEDVRCWPGVRDWRVAIGESPALAVELELGPSSHMKETRSETEGTLQCVKPGTEYGAALPVWLAKTFQSIIGYQVGAGK